jgi:hypothetical protein
MDNDSKKITRREKNGDNSIMVSLDAQDLLFLNNREYREMLHGISRPATNFSPDVLMY